MNWLKRPADKPESQLLGTPNSPIPSLQSLSTTTSASEGHEHTLEELQQHVAKSSGDSLSKCSQDSRSLDYHDDFLLDAICFTDQHKEYFKQMEDSLFDPNFGLRDVPQHPHPGGPLLPFTLFSDPGVPHAALSSLSTDSHGGTSSGYESEERNSLVFEKTNPPLSHLSNFSDENKQIDATGSDVPLVKASALGSLFCFSSSMKPYELEDSHQNVITPCMSPEYQQTDCVLQDSHTSCLKPHKLTSCVKGANGQEACIVQDPHFPTWLHPDELQTCAKAAVKSENFPIDYCEVPVSTGCGGRKEYTQDDIDYKENISFTHTPSFQEIRRQLDFEALVEKAKLRQKYHMAPPTKEEWMAWYAKVVKQEPEPLLPELQEHNSQTRMSSDDSFVLPWMPSSTLDESSDIFNNHSRHENHECPPEENRRIFSDESNESSLVELHREIFLSEDHETTDGKVGEESTRGHHEYRSHVYKKFWTEPDESVDSIHEESALADMLVESYSSIFDLPDSVEGENGTKRKALSSPVFLEAHVKLASSSSEMLDCPTSDEVDHTHIGEEEENQRVQMKFKRNTTAQNFFNLEESLDILDDLLKINHSSRFNQADVHDTNQVVTHAPNSFRSSDYFDDESDVINYVPTSSTYYDEEMSKDSLALSADTAFRSSNYFQEESDVIDYVPPSIKSSKCYQDGMSKHSLALFVDTTFKSIALHEDDASIQSPQLRGVQFDHSRKDYPSTTNRFTKSCYVRLEPPSSNGRRNERLQYLKHALGRKVPQGHLSAISSCNSEVSRRTDRLKILQMSRSARMNRVGLNA